MTDDISALAKMMMIRAFEEALAARADHGFQLLSSGEEAVAVGLAAHLHDGDQLLSGGRSIGAALARGIPANRLMAELLGKVDGPNQGRAGRGHLADPGAGFFGAHAVVGGNISIAAGVALARKLEGSPAIVAALFGDGACGGGGFLETLNMAALWQLPLLLVCSNNELSVSTRREDANAAKRLSDPARAYGWYADTCDGTDITAVRASVTKALDHVRAGKGPAFVECLSIRLRSHSTTARETRSRDALSLLRSRDPIAREIKRLGIDEATVTVMTERARVEAQNALRFAEDSPYPNLSECLDHVI